MVKKLESYLDYILKVNKIDDLELKDEITSNLIDKYNDYIKKNNLGKENYICYNYTHTINDFYFNESTKMIINNSHIKIKTNKNVPSFFYNIRNFKNIFVCDFNNHDYFLLEDTIYSSCITS